MKSRLLVWSLWLLALVAGSSAQPAPPPVSLDPHLAMSRYVHDSWVAGEGSGLPQNTINAIAQGDEGYLWIGTQVGLVRFDGVAFTIFDRRSHPAFESNHIEVLLPARKGGLWIGTDGGGISRLVDNEVTTYTIADGLAGNVVRSLYEDSQGKVWIGTLGSGLDLFDGNTFRHFDRSNGLDALDVLAIEEDRAGTLWVGTESGLFYSRNGQFVAFPGPRPGNTVITALHTGNDGTLWAGTLSGNLCRLSTQQAFCYSVEASGGSGGISSINEDYLGTLWLGTLGGGIVRFAEGRFSAFTSREGLTHDHVRTAFLDREGSLWIGTAGGGLNRLRGSVFSVYSKEEGLQNEVVLAVIEDPEGAVWIGTDGGGLHRLQDETIRHFGTRDGMPNEYVLSLGLDSQGRIWVGLYDGGACYYAGDRFHCLTRDNGLASNNVFVVYGDRSGAVWIGTDAGLNHFDGNTITTFNTASGLSHDLVTAVYEDVKGDLWVGTYGGGLTRIRDATISNPSVDHYGMEQGLSSNSILTLHEDKEADLWIGTQGGGLCRLRNDKIACLSTTGGLHSEDVLQILEDEEGYFWLGSLNGISRVKKTEISAALNRDIDRVNPVIYGEADGLRSAETNGGTQPAAWRSRDGRLWFSTADGIAVHDPQFENVNTLPFPVVIERLLVQEKEQPLSNDVVLPPGSRNLELHYTALTFTTSHNVQFRYRLEPLDTEWVSAGRRRSAYYNSLPPGTYHFRVQAKNVEGEWHEAEQMLSFVVEPFFYETPAFFVGVALLIVFGFALAYRLRIRHLKARERKLKVTVEDRTRELRAREQELKTLNENLEQEVQRQLAVILEQRVRYENELIDAKERAEESARLKSTILTNMSHEIRTPISAILGFSQILAEEVGQDQQEFVEYIRESGERLQNTLNSILDLSRLEADGFRLDVSPFDIIKTTRGTVDLLGPLARKKGLVLHSKCDLESLTISHDEGAVERVLQNLIGNAIKFTESGEVSVEVALVEEQVRLQVRDTGVGIGEEFLSSLFEAFKQESVGLSRKYEGTGLGLSITRRLVVLMGGRIEVKSKKGAGSTFTVYLPRSCNSNRNIRVNEQVAGQA